MMVPKWTLREPTELRVRLSGKARLTIAESNASLLSSRVCLAITEHAAQVKRNFEDAEDDDVRHEILEYAQELLDYVHDWAAISKNRRSKTTGV